MIVGEAAGVGVARVPIAGGRGQATPNDVGSG